VVSLETGHGGQSGIFAAIGLGILLAVLSRARWATSAGFSPLWGGFTFPVAACAVAFMTLGGVWLVPGIAALAAASVLIPYIATRVLRGWAQGWLGPKTGAAVA
jgi:tellurite resistance protein